MMEKKTGEQASESAAAPASESSIPHLRKKLVEEDEDESEYQLRSSSSPPMNAERNLEDPQQQQQHPPTTTATIDHLEQQIRRHLSERSREQQQQQQEPPHGEHNEDRWDSQHSHADDSSSWGQQTQPPPSLHSSQPNTRREEETQSGQWDRTRGAAEVGDHAPAAAGLRREGVLGTGNSPMFQLPVPSLPQVSASYLLPPPLMTYPLPGASNQPGGVAAMSQVSFPAMRDGGGSHAVGGHGIGIGIGGSAPASDAMLERSSSNAAAQAQAQAQLPYNHLYHSTFSPGTFTYESIDRSSMYRRPSNDIHHHLPHGGNAAAAASSALPFPIINIPFRSKADRAGAPAPAPAAAARPDSTGDAQGGSRSAAASDGAREMAAAAAVPNFRNPVSAMLWKEHLPSTGKEPTFPMKLHQILASPQFQGCICWNSHGRSWRIIKTQEFERTVIPLFFQHSKYSSFLRQVNGWGFERIVTGADHGSYFSRFFLRDDPSLCLTMKRKAKKKKPSATDDAVGPAREDGRVVMNPPTNADAGAASTAAWKPTAAAVAGPLQHHQHQQHGGSSGAADTGGSTRSSREGTITTTAAAARSFSYGAPASQLRPPHFSTSATAPPDFLRGDHGYSSHDGVSGAVSSSSGALPPSRRCPRGLDSGQHDPRGGGASHMMTATMGLEDFQQMYFSSLQSTTPIARSRGGDNPHHQQHQTVAAASHNSHADRYFHDETTRFHPQRLSHEELARNVAFGGQGSGTPPTRGDVSGRIVDHQASSWLHSSSYRQRANNMPDASLQTSQQEQQSRIPSMQSHNYQHHSRPQGSASATASYPRSGGAGDNNAILSSGSGDDWNHHGDPVEDALPPHHGAVASGALPLGAMSPLHFDQEDDDEDDNGSLGSAE